MRAVCLAVFLLPIAAPVAASENLPDPTRPPPEFGGDAAAAGAFGAAPGGGAATAGRQGLQSVVLHKKGRSYALINGETVRLGDMVGDKKLVRISEGEVMLSGPQGQEILKLTPGVEKQLVQRKPARAAGRQQ